MRPLTVDTETTGFEAVGGGIIEIAGVWRSEDLHELRWVESLCLPYEGVRIESDAKACHHIQEADLVGAPTPAEVLLRLLEQSRSSSPVIFVAHNAPFDREFIEAVMVGGGWPDIAWVDTCRCAKHLWPEAPRFGNQVLRYHLGLEPQVPSSSHPHRALYDAITTEAILQKMLETHTVYELVELTKKPVVLHTIGFGKYKGKLWREVDRGYLRWVLRQDFDEDVVHTAGHYLHGG
jgi:exodeoxyribonuclease X